ncbi:nuclear transport factor 2 family protein [Rhodococcus sp. PAMC28707]|uniref:nuclear transport factor 2 family protein n=1 Tax=unclassified Rhodococcus (in: high G+C Gram-positive bacteria) TaxID=192944 RepID=UPI00109DA945|nr:MULTISPECIES: nuclear transport factor 2 family protein [unclassified Rhodococcus (in: high G+C Gram-positive bacteria)]QCB49624.1 nuclear transport factor 2 family protein [Rhodococcus sp. PAMC28705]QCB58685.1 nuclear transport factor 2 family protein [Rhodococcus sp. PAMC28707]
MRKFTDAVEAGDHSAVEALLAENVRFTSPVAFEPYDGKAITSAILHGVLRVFENFHYTETIESGDERDHALIFEAMIDGKTINGCDFLHLDENGLIDDFVVMVRPLSAAMALSAAMGAQFPQITAEAAQYRLAH